MSLQKVILEIITQQHLQGVVAIYRGVEGSGKTTLAKKFADGFGNSGDFIPFSQHLQAYAEGKGKSHPMAKAALVKMAKREKDIDHRFLCSALRSALGCVSPTTSVISIEGWLRQVDQCRDTLQLIADRCPHHLLVVIEVTCSMESALARALSRGGNTDKEELIVKCHREYEAKRDHISRACEGWAHTLTVSAEGEPEETFSNLAQAFDGLKNRLAKKEVYTKTPAKIFGWREETQLIESALAAA